MHLDTDLRDIKIEYVDLRNLKIESLNLDKIREVILGN
jgi:hypothetical protein